MGGGAEKRKRKGCGEDKKGCGEEKKRGAEKRKKGCEEEKKVYFGATVHPDLPGRSK